MKEKKYNLKQSVILEKEAIEYLDNDFEGLIDLFLKYLDNENIEIYNEDSLKFELGIFLRIILPEHHVCFEKNIENFTHKNDTLKHEIDITIYPKESNQLLNNSILKLIDPKETYAIELKFPSFRIKENNNNDYIRVYNNGGNQILENLEKDMLFVNQLVNNDFKKAWSFVLVHEISNSIYQFPNNLRKEPSNIYYRFRENSNNKIRNNVYKITWFEWKNKGKYYIKEGHDVKKEELENIINKKQN